jgi:membrane associated rhomboid family serine protease
MATCYRHPNRETGVSCSNCGKPICPDCMTPTPVGMRCPECARQRTHVHTMRTMSRNAIPATLTLIGMNVLAFLASGQFSVTSTSSTSVFRNGALIGSGPPIPQGFPYIGKGVAYHEYWRIVTGAFLHDGLLHIGLNMYILYLLGQMLEPAIGTRRFVLVYSVSLLGGALGALITTPHAPTVGASGAIFGLMGATAVEAHARGIDLRNNPVIALIVLNLVLSFALPGISYGGHIGGLLAGGLVGGAMLVGHRMRQPAVAWGLSIIIGAAALAGCILTSNATKPVVDPVQLQQLEQAQQQALQRQ